MEIDYQKDINSVCYCGKAMGHIRDEIIMLEPCEHMIHKKCYGKSNKHICQICNITIETVLTINMLKKEKDTPKYYQKYVDILSIQDFSDKSIPSNNKNFITSLPKIINLLSILPFSSGFTDGKFFAGSFLSMLNCKLVINGIENIKNIDKVIISNHISSLDLLVYFYIFKCGMLASSMGTDSPITQKCSSLFPILFIKRGKTSNTVEKMKEIVKKIGSILLFPEGMCVNPNTLAKFRTGAFHIGYPVCPAVISYNPLIYDSDTFELIKKIFSSEGLTITVNILPMEYPPFSPEKIETIRTKMAISGNMALSRVSSRGIID